MPLHLLLMVLSVFNFGYQKNKYLYMLLQPKKTKYKKNKKGSIPKLSFNTTKLNFGTIGLKAIESGTITARQIEAARQAINRKIKRKGKVWIRIFPSISVTAKPTAVRMGKGKGSVSHWVAKVGAGTILFEICGVNTFNSISALKTGSAKLAIKTKIIT